ncbi:MAG: hypothetical protein AB1468_00865 [Candidatus Micrarchaeota archaeon]
MLDRKCQYCGVNFSKKPKESYKQFNSKRFCSKKCKGKATPKNILEKFHAAGVESARGRSPWNKGLKCPQISVGRKGLRFSEEHKKKLSEVHRGLLIGEKNPNWSPKITTCCTTCGKPLSRTTYRLDRAKAWFCSNRCQILYRYKLGEFPRQINTIIEILVKNELLERRYVEGTDFFHQFKFYDKFMCDFAFPKQRVIVECDGDFWHVNPTKYAGKPLKQPQKNTLAKDRSKEAYIKKVDNGSWSLLRFWESDIKKDVKLCVDKIEWELKKKSG